MLREFEAIASMAMRRSILSQIASLEDDPRPAEAEQLPERPIQFRIRRGRYRLLYEIKDRSREVTVYRIVDSRPYLNTG